MPIKINKPTVIEAQGNKPILISEFFGKINSSDTDVSIAYLKCPGNWIEPGQIPEFDEYTVVLKGCLRVSTKQEYFDIKTGEAIMTKKNEWVQYSTPTEEGAEYIAVCLPAFSPNNVHRDEM